MELMVVSMSHHRTTAHPAWLHEALVIIEGLDSCGSRREGGRGIFVSDTCAKVLPVGTLLLEEEPMVLAKDYSALWLRLLALGGGADSEILPQADNGQDPQRIRQVLATMYAGPGLWDAAPARRLRGILAHNMHSADPLPFDGRPPMEDGPVGIWPTASLLNHSFSTPNVARTFVPGRHAVQHRAILELHPGDEVLDNYLDTCMKHTDRASIMLRQHGMTEPSDNLDAPVCFHTEVDALTSRAAAALAANRVDSSLLMLLPLFKRLVSENAGAASSKDMSGSLKKLRDPALADFFDIFGEAAHRSGQRGLAITSWSHEFGLVCGREAYCYRSAMLAARLALISALPAEDEPSVEKVWDECEQASDWLGAARTHWQVVFGGACVGGSFETHNPKLCSLSGLSVREGVVGATSATESVGGDPGTVLLSNTSQAAKASVLRGGESNGPVAQAIKNPSLEAGRAQDGWIAEREIALEEGDEAWSLFM